MVRSEQADSTDEADVELDRGGGPVATAVHALLVSPRGALALTLVYFACLLTLGLTQRYLHDEGVFTLDLARIGTDAPIQMLFFQKAKPVLMIVYSIPAVLGVHAFTIVHAALGALAVHLTMRAARLMGLGAPNLAGWVLVCSSSFTIAASNGYPNADGAFFAALFLSLYAADRRVGAALVLGVLPFARHELAALSLTFLIWDGWTRRDARFTLTALSLPLTYALAGAGYHRDLFWLYHAFPNPAGLPAEIRVFPVPSVREALAGLGAALAANAPMLTSFAVVGSLQRDRRLFPLLACGFLVYLGMPALRLFDLLGFDDSPRYYVTALPVLAIVAAGALPPRKHELASWSAAALLCVACIPVTRVVATVSAGFILLAALLAGARRRREFAAALLVAISAVMAAAQLAFGASRERDQHLAFHHLIEEMEKRSLYAPGEPLYADIPIARYDSHIAIGESRLLANAAIAWETQTFLNPENDQRRRLLSAAESHGMLLFPERHRVRRDAVYTLADGPRTRTWREHLESAGARAERVGKRWVYRFPDAGVH